MYQTHQAESRAFRRLSGMEHVHTINGLKEHRSRIAGDFDFYQEKLVETQAPLAAVNRTLRSLGYEGNDITAPPQPVLTAGLFRTGELSRTIMALLREHPEGMTVQEIAEAICRSRGWETADKRWMAALRQKVGKSLQKKRARGLAVGGQRDGGWFWCCSLIVNESLLSD